MRETTTEPEPPGPRARRAARGRVRRRRIFRILLLVLLGSIALLVWEGCAMFRMPGKSHSGPLPPLTDRQTALRDALRADLEVLAREIGPRSLRNRGGLRRAEAFLAGALESAGYVVERHGYEAYRTPVHNLVTEIRGADAPDEILVVGAHYDTVSDCPGANDNGSGVVGVLALARAFAATTPRRTLRFVLFVNEEPPHFQTPTMGSLVYARRCKERDENVVGMLSLETIGYYDDREGTQRYPFPLGLFRTSRANFISFVGNRASRAFVRRVVGSFRRHARFPSQGAALPGFVAAAGWSDHWAFWQQGYPALMVTDTAMFRDDTYHTPRDTIEHIDFDGLARVVDGLHEVVAELSGVAVR